MRSRAVLGALAAASLVAATAASAAKQPKVGVGLPYYRSGSVVGSGLPLKAFASITPTVHLFGDTIQARLAVMADARLVDPSLIRVHGGFLPYVPIGAPAVDRVQVGPLTQLTWTWSLRCLDAACVPVAPPSEKYHVFRFHPVHVDVVRPSGTVRYGITAGWPPIEVESQISPAVVRTLALYGRLDWRYRLTPLASPTYARSPSLLFWLAIGLAGVMFLAAALAVTWWYLAIKPRKSRAATGPGTPLEQALALMVWAHAHGDETLQRKAFERVADELVALPAEKVEELSQTARELAWSARLPADDEIDSFAREALQKGRRNGHPQEADE